MINTGNNNVLEKTTVDSIGNTYETRQNGPAVSGSVSGDLMRNYAEKGLLFEETLNETSVSNETYFQDGEFVDITPSATTMQFTAEEDDFVEDDYTSAQKAYKISARGKIMITVYALVVATIIALIAMNAHVLRAMERSIDEKQSAVAELAQQTDQLAEELEYVSSEEVISRKAIEMGMGK